MYMPSTCTCTRTCTFTCTHTCTSVCICMSFGSFFNCRLMSMSGVIYLLLLLVLPHLRLQVRVLFDVPSTRIVQVLVESFLMLGDNRSACISVAQLVRQHVPARFRVRCDVSCAYGSTFWASLCLVMCLRHGARHIHPSSLKLSKLC